MDKVSYSILKNAYLNLQEENERLRLLYENADKSLAYWEKKCRRLEAECKYWRGK